MTNISIPIGSTAEVQHDAELREGPGGCTRMLAVVTEAETATVVWRAASDSGAGAELPSWLGSVVVEEAREGHAAGRTIAGVGSGVFSFRAEYSARA